MLSFDAHYDVIAKKITEWEGRFLSKNFHFSHPLILLFLARVAKALDLLFFFSCLPHLKICPIFPDFQFLISIYPSNGT